jgi:hypothetical protein
MSVNAMFRQQSSAVLTLAAGGAGVVVGIPKCPKKQEKHSSQWQAAYYGTNT